MWWTAAAPRERDRGESGPPPLAQGETRVDGLILTHFDEDHVSGRPSASGPDAGGAALHTACTGGRNLRDFGEGGGRTDMFRGRGRALGPGTGRAADFAPLSRTSSNESGLSVLFTAGEYDTLITGDMNQNLERQAFGNPRPAGH